MPFGVYSLDQLSTLFITEKRQNCQPVIIFLQNSASKNAEIVIRLGMQSTLRDRPANAIESFWYMYALLKKLPELKTKEGFIQWMPQKIDKQMVDDLRKNIKTQIHNCFTISRAGLISAYAQHELF
jgi:hypothetical protein